MTTYSTSVRVPDVIITRRKVSTTWTETSSSTPIVIGSNVVDRNSNPNYRIQIAKGIDAGRPYARTSYEIAPGYYRMTSSGPNVRESYYYRTIGAQLPLLLPSFTWNGRNVVSEASTRLRRKLRETTGSSNQLANLVELRELPRTIVGAAESALGLLSSVSTSKRKGRDLRKYASDAWLTWSFGISPTLGAIDDLIASIDAYKNRQDICQRDYGIDSADAHRSTGGPSGGPDGYQVRLNGHFEQSYGCKLSAAYRVNLRSDNSYTMAKHLGFSIDKVIPTAWELLPFSWMFDYFSNAGQYLEDTFEVSPSKQIYLCQSVRNTIIGEIHATPVKLNQGFALLDFKYQPCKVKMIQFTRTPLATLPRATLRLKTANEVGFSAVTKLLNLTSLLGSKS